MNLNMRLICIGKGCIITGFIFMLCILINAGVVYATVYYVSFSQGTNSNQGDSPAHPWKTLSKVNGHLFKPGDKILLKRDDVWEESLIISWSGTAESPIMLKPYGFGRNPRIKCSTTFNNWKIALEMSGEKIWKGTISGVKNSWGAIKNNERLPQYLPYIDKNSQWSAPQNILFMKNNFFYAPLNQAEFYLSYNKGNPGPVEVGSRKFGISIKGQSHVIIDSIDVYGPGGRADNGGSDDFRQVVIDQCDYVHIRNSTLSFHNCGGAIIRNNSSNCIYENVVSYGHKGTGLYFWEAGKGNKAMGCEVFDCGLLETDFGDMGLIGIWQSPNVSIKKCYVHNNGHGNPQGCDAGISFAQSPYGVVYGCYVKDTCDRSLQFAENSDYGMVAYSIFENWGVYGASITRWPDIVGVRLGGGKSDSTARGCKIYNNLFINGGATQGDWAALKIGYRINDGTEIKNNIFYNNKGIYEIYAGSKNNFQDWDIKNNLFWGTGDKAIYWDGKRYDHNHITGNIQGNFSHDCRQEAGSLSENPELSFNPYKLEPQSQCIDSGISVGLKQDYYGNSVPSGKGVDIGPFEYQGSASCKLGPPKNIRIQ